MRTVAGPSHCYESGSVHPGVIFSLADASRGVVMVTHGSRRIVTVEMKAGFIAPAIQGELLGIGRVLQEDEEIAVLEAQVSDGEGNLPATSMAAFMKIIR